MELKMENVHKEFQEVAAVDGVSYTLTKGVYGLLGANGAGKTTLMRILCTLLKPSEGTVTWNGTDIFSMDGEYRKLLGYLPQDFGFYPDFTVNDYLMYIASIKGLRPAIAKQRSEELLSQVGLTKVKDRKMKKLSGGMKRRAGIAQALLNNPQILILDEPTAGLDPNERIRFRNLLSELGENRIVLLSTHIVSDIEFIANEIIMMKGGKFCYTGTSGQLISSMDMMVWNCVVPQGEVNHYLKEYKVGNIKTTSGGAELRILSKVPPTENAIRGQATLEDAFFLYFGKKAGNQNDAEI